MERSCDTFCVMYSLIIHFGIKKYELSLTIDIGLLHMYHVSVLTPKQHEIPLIVSRQISIPNVSPNLTDAHIRKQVNLAIVPSQISSVGAKAAILKNGRRVTISPKRRSGAFIVDSICFWGAYFRKGIAEYIMPLFLRYLKKWPPFPK